MNPKMTQKMIKSHLLMMAHWHARLCFYLDNDIKDEIPVIAGLLRDAIDASSHVGIVSDVKKYKDGIDELISGASEKDLLTQHVDFVDAIIKDAGAV